MATTYEPIATTTLGSATNSVTFSSISGSYTDIVMICGYSHSTASNILLRVNGDTGTNYSNTYLEGLNSAAGSGRDSNKAQINIGYSFDTNINTNILHFMNYSNTTTYKTVLSRQGNPSSYIAATVGLWRSTSAITSINVYASNGNFNSNSVFTLYGIKAA
jgi:hypothetical protein